MMEKDLKYGWMNWEEIAPFRNQLVDMELDLMITYHYPDWDIPRSYVKTHVDSLKQYIANGNTYFWGVWDDKYLYGYFWGYVSAFIDKSRWNNRSTYFKEELKGKGYSALGMEASIRKAKEVGCDQIVTHYAAFNGRMGAFLKKYNFLPMRVEMVRDI